MPDMQSYRAIVQGNRAGQLCNAVLQRSPTGQSGRADLQRRQAEYRGGVVKQGSQVESLLASKAQPQAQMHALSRPHPCI